MGLQSLSSQPTPAALGKSGEEGEEEEEATSGRSEVPRRGSRALGYQRRGPRAGEEGKQQGLAWGKKGNVVGARGKQINRVVETIATKRRLIKVKNEDCVTPKTNRK